MATKTPAAKTDAGTDASTTKPKRKATPRTKVSPGFAYQTSTPGVEGEEPVVSALSDVYGDLAAMMDDISLNASKDSTVTLFKAFKTGKLKAKVSLK